MSASHGFPGSPLIRQGVRPRQLVSILRCWALDWAANPADWRGRSHQRARSLAVAAVTATMLISGCATCREHPVACAAAVIVTGAVAAHELERRDGRRPAERKCFDLPPDACL